MYMYMYYPIIVIFLLTVCALKSEYKLHNYMQIFLPKKVHKSILVNQIKTINVRHVWPRWLHMQSVDLNSL